LGSEIDELAVANEDSEEEARVVIRVASGTTSKSLIRVLMRCADRERSGSISSSSTTIACCKGPHRFFVTQYHPSACAPLVLAPFRRQPMISTNLLLFLPSSMSQPGRLQGHHQYIRNGRRYRLSDHFHFTTAAQQLKAYWVGSH
jgi:N-acetyl-gamma-glutamylphosphate reductase